jgi:hypothetical protein
MFFRISVQVLALLKTRKEESSTPGALADSASGSVMSRNWLSSVLHSFFLLEAVNHALIIPLIILIAPTVILELPYCTVHTLQL